MTKRQLIDEITMRNPTAKTDFLARFEEADLGAYLDHLIVGAPPQALDRGQSIREILRQRRAHVGPDGATRL